MSDGEALYPLEVIVQGVPVSHQGSAQRKDTWKGRVKDAVR
ncbi:MAG: hypothetical protein RL367_2509, partial [Pseudomonadota bacterium]